MMQTVDALAITRRDQEELVWFFAHAGGDAASIMAQQYEPCSRDTSDRGWGHIAIALDRSKRVARMFRVERVRDAMLARPGGQTHWGTLARAYGPLRRTDPHGVFAAERETDPMHRTRSQCLAAVARYTLEAQSRATEAAVQQERARLLGIAMHAARIQGGSPMSIAARQLEAVALVPDTPQPPGELVEACMRELFDALRTKDKKKVDLELRAAIRREAEHLLVQAEHAWRAARVSLDRRPAPRAERIARAEAWLGAAE
jgi:hypothetical protein